MNPETLQAYRPKREHVKLIITWASRWAIYFAPLAKVVDVAVVQNALPFATVLTAGEESAGFFLRPKDPTLPPPTQAEFSAILEHGFDAVPLPILTRRQAV